MSLWSSLIISVLNSTLYQPRSRSDEICCKCLFPTLQEPILFSCSIAENIAYGADDPSLVTAEQVERVADVANATAFIRSFPQGFSTVVGEKGTLLSGTWWLPPGGGGPHGPRGLAAFSSASVLRGLGTPRPLSEALSAWGQLLRVPRFLPRIPSGHPAEPCSAWQCFSHLRKGVFCHPRPLKTAQTPAGAGGGGVAWAADTR